MSEPEFSDVESTGFPSDISGNDYSASSEDETPNVEIDMDSRPDSCVSVKKSSNPRKPDATLVKQPAIIKRTIIKQPSSSSSKQLEKKPNTEPRKKLIKESSKPSKSSKEISNEDPSSEKGTAKEKESAADSKFQFNEESIEYFCKDILGDVKKILTPNSSFYNDTALLCLLFKLQIFTEYKCVEKKCKTGKTWLGHPIQLLIHRKNGKQHDLTTSNLELMCANCYIAKYGLDIFMKVIAKTIYKCSYCGYPLSNFNNSKKKERICMACESKIMTSGYFKQRSQFMEQLSDTIDEASTLKKDEFKSSNYYSHVSQFKSFDNTENWGGSGCGDGFKAKKSTIQPSTKTFNDKPIIQLNLTVPNIDDLIIEE